MDNTVVDNDLKGKKEKTVLLSVLILLIVIAILLVIAIIAVNSSTRNDSQRIDNTNDEQTSSREDDTKTDCSHEKVDLQTLTKESNQNIYNLDYYHTTSDYLCLEDWGIALRLPSSINSVIYTPIYDDDTYHISYLTIKAILSVDGNINWGGNYMADSKFDSGIATISRVSKDRANQMGNVPSYLTILETDDYIYFTNATTDTLLEYYRTIIEQEKAKEHNDTYYEEAPEEFFDDVKVLNDLILDSNNYVIMDESKA